MDSIFEKARISIREGWKGIITAFFVLLFIAYTFIWAIMEPLNLADNFGCSNEFYLNRIFLHIILSFVFSLLTTYFLYIRLKFHLEKISLNPNDTNLKTCWTITEGQVNFEELRDGYFGKVLKFEGEDHYAIDYNVKPKAHKAQIINYIANPQNGFALYLKVKLKSKINDDTSSKWIVFVLNSVSPLPHGSGEFEWSYPVTPHFLSGDWMRFSIKLEKAVKETHGTAGWEYFGLEKIRIRGNGILESININ